MDEDSQSTPARSPVADWTAPPAEIARNAHVAQVMWGAAVLDNLLVTLLAHSLPNLSRRMRERLFEGYGPLGNFAPRLDMAFAMGIIGEKLREDMVHIKDLRNLMAHSPSRADLNDAAVRSILSRLRGYTPEKDPLHFFFDRVQDCLRGLWDLIEKLAKEKGVKIEPPAWPPGR
jgi:Mannitol repressor